jgi:hypothetical protein
VSPVRDLVVDGDLDGEHVGDHLGEDLVHLFTGTGSR